MMGKSIGLGVLLVAVHGALAGATAIVDVGDHRLRPDTPGQTITIQVAGDEQVEALNFHVQVADGGPHPAVGGVIEGPAITAVDLATGTIFSGNSAGQSDVVSLPQVWLQTIITDSGAVLADGLLATLTIDTTGFLAGTYSLALGDTINGPTDFALTAIDIRDGAIHVVPEPSSLLLAGFASIWLPWRRLRGTSKGKLGSGRPQ